MSVSPSDLQSVAEDVQQALPIRDNAQIAHGDGYSFVITDKKIFEIYASGESVFVTVATRDHIEPVGDDTMWWATVDGERNPHFTDEALEPYRVGDESTYLPHNWPTQAQFDAASAAGANYGMAQFSAGANEPQESPLSGEWADGPTSITIARDVGFKDAGSDAITDSMALDEIADAWERGYNDYWAHA